MGSWLYPSPGGHGPLCWLDGTRRRQLSPIGRIRRLSLFRRVFLVDALVLALAALFLAWGPVTISYPIRLEELLVILAGLVTAMSLSVVLLRRTMRPLETLKATMRRIDPLSPGARVEVPNAGADVAELARAFNEMLERLESERRESGRMALSVQESERQRVARELHDEVGQTLTAMLLQIEGLAADVPMRYRDELNELRETARVGAEDVRRIARRLRPEALEELGLRAALLTLITNFTEQSEVRVDHRIEPALPLTVEEELVVYRVAQEALTNVVRHSDAGHAELSLGLESPGVVLGISDDGRGIGQDEIDSSYGIRGMRERAVLIGARLTIDSGPGDGTRVVLSIPSER